MTKYSETFTIPNQYSPQFLLEIVEESLRLNNTSIEFYEIQDDLGKVKVEGRTAFGVFVFPQKVTVDIEVTEKSAIFHIAASLFQLTFHNPEKTTVKNIWGSIVNIIERKMQFKIIEKQITLGELSSKLDNLKNLYANKVLNEGEIQDALNELFKSVAQKGLSTEPLRDYLLLIADYMGDFPKGSLKEAIPLIKDLKKEGAQELGENTIEECQLKAESLRKIYEEANDDRKKEIAENYKRIKKREKSLQMQRDFKLVMTSPEQNVVNCKWKLQLLEPFYVKANRDSKARITNKINELKGKIIQFEREAKKRNRKYVAVLCIMAAIIIIALVSMKVYTHHQSSTTEDALYNSAIHENSKNLIQNYLDMYGIDGRHSKEAVRAVKKIEETQAFNEVKKLHTVPAYKGYIKEFGESAIYHQEATDAIKQIEALKNAKTRTDDNAYEEAVRKGTPKAYRTYVKEFGKSGLHYKEALESVKSLNLAADKRDYIKAKKENSKKAYNEYIDRYGKFGTHYRDAVNEIRLIDNAIAEKEENGSWEKARGENTVQAYRNYQQNHPYGRHSLSAREMILVKMKENELVAQKKDIKEVKEHLIEFYSHRMAIIPAGRYLMGSRNAYGNEDERPAHRVVISKSFYLCKYEVTQGEWKAIMKTTPWEGLSYVKEGDDFPATCLPWDQIQEFTRRLNKMTGLSFRLPTEAEWEYACRAGTKTKYYWGNTMDGNYCWWSGNAWNKGERYAHEVGQKKPNAFGLYDMSGNVAEMCADWYSKKYYSISPSKDPKGPPTGDSSDNPFLHDFRVCRGGSWMREQGLCRSANRYISFLEPSEVGFRLVMTKK